MRLRFIVTRRNVLGERVLEVGDVIDLNLATGECFIAAAVPSNVGAVLGLVSDGSADPVDETREAAMRRLTGLSSHRASSSHPTPLRLLKG